MAFQDLWNRVIGPLSGAGANRQGRPVQGGARATVTDPRTGQRQRRPVTVYTPNGKSVPNINRNARLARIGDGIGKFGVLSGAATFLGDLPEYARDALDYARLRLSGVTPRSLEDKLRQYGFDPGKHKIVDGRNVFERTRVDQGGFGRPTTLRIVPRSLSFDAPLGSSRPGFNEPGHIRDDGKVYVNRDYGYQNRSTANRLFGNIYDTTRLGEIARLYGKPVVYEMRKDGSLGWVPTTEAIYAAAQRRNARQSGGSSNNPSPLSRRTPEGGVGAGGQNNGGSGGSVAPPRPANVDPAPSPAAPPAGEQQESGDVLPPPFDPISTVFSGQFPELVRDPLKMNAAAAVARRYQDQMNNLVSLLGSEDQVRRLAFETQAPTVFKIDNDKEVKPKLSDYYQAQQLIGQQLFNQNSTSLDQVIKELGYNDDLKTWALANPALAQREYAKMLKQQGSSIPTIPAIPSGAQNIADQVTPTGGQIVVDPIRFYRPPYEQTTEQVVNWGNNT